MTFIGELQVQKPRNLQYDSAWRVINSVRYEHFHFSEKSALFHKWVSQISQQQKLIYHFSPTLLYKEKYLAFICEYFRLCNLCFITISNNSVWAFPLTEPGQMLSNAHFDDSYCLLSSTILFYEMSNISPVLSVSWLFILEWSESSLKLVQDPNVLEENWRQHLLRHNHELLFPTCARNLSDFVQ